ncbi:hypothetical protein DPMN_090821 [Dreissena polymorpha]|uniref:Uncharacterized protein n=1 Tax=Dreissena polymorpha TaxID=45954 RepID=A0A9D4L0H0_DREPO|nr:hypothetical protein DPMN_090821 [Dreissena polymorpha]
MTQKTRMQPQTTTGHAAVNDILIHIEKHVADYYGDDDDSHYRLLVRNDKDHDDYLALRGANFIQLPRQTSLVVYPLTTYASYPASMSSEHSIPLLTLQYSHGTNARGSAKDRSAKDRSAKDRSAKDRSGAKDRR